MSTSTLWDDDFSGYTPGSNNVLNWYDPGNDARIVAFSTMTGSSQAPGFYEQTGQGYHLSGDQIFYENLTAQDHTQISWLGWGSVYNVAVFNANLSLGTGSNAAQGQLICALSLNSDYTMQLFVSSTLGSPIGVFPIAVTPQQVWWPGVWQYFQLNIITNTVLVGGTGFVGVTASLALEGTQIMSGTATTNLDVASLWTGLANFNQWTYGGAPGANGYLGNFTGIVGSPLPAFGVFPHPGVPDAFLTQGVVEAMLMPDASVRQARVTQGVNELIKLPSSSVRQARMTQGVVEILLRSVPGGWFVYEA